MGMFLHQMRLGEITLLPNILETEMIILGDQIMHYLQLYPELYHPSTLTAGSIVVT
jgi:hypothetical protein